MPVETLMLAYNENQRHFGENYVQEICEKAPQMPGDIQWHFIGGLQSNKAKVLVNTVKGLYMVERYVCVCMHTYIHTHTSDAVRQSSLQPPLLAPPCFAHEVRERERERLTERQHDRERDRQTGQRLGVTAPAEQRPTHTVSAAKASRQSWTRRAREPSATCCVSWCRSTRARRRARVAAKNMRPSLLRSTLSTSARTSSSRG